MENKTNIFTMWQDDQTTSENTQGNSFFIRAFREMHSLGAKYEEDAKNYEPREINAEDIKTIKEVCDILTRYKFDDDLYYAYENVVEFLDRFEEDDDEC